MEYLLSIKLQIAEICFTLVILYQFMRSKRVPLLATKWFNIMVWLNVVTLIVDMLSIYTLNYMTDTRLNAFIHRLFYILTLTMVFSFAAYVEMVGNAKNTDNKTMAWQGTLACVPYVITVICVLVLDIRYEMDGRGAYSDGPAVYALFVGILFYIIVVLFGTYRYKEIIAERKMQSINLMAIIWIVSLILQSTIQYILISGLAISVSLVLIYYSFENAEKYIDEELDVFNKKGFESYFFEECSCFGKKPFYLIALVLENTELLKENIDEKNFAGIMGILNARFMLEIDSEVFRIADNILVAKAPYDTDSCKGILADIEYNMRTPVELPCTTVSVKVHALVFDCPKLVKELHELVDILDMDIYDRDQFATFVSDEMIAKKDRKNKLVELVHEAIEHDGLDVFYQPIYSTKEKQCVSAEALVRLKDNKTLGFVSPEEFVPIAEKNNHIIQLGDTVFEKSCDTVAEIRKLGMRVDYIEVNVSAAQMLNDSITRNYIGSMRAKGLSPSSINIEITERLAAGSEGLIASNMKIFKDAGCTFSMDDFGTGYSNLASMAELSYDMIKIDKSLIWPCFGENASEKARTMLLGMIELVHKLGGEIVAEGIETKEMVDFLTEQGVEYLQGYYFSKPVNKEAYIEYLKKQNDEMRIDN